MPENCATFHILFFFYFSETLNIVIETKQLLMAINYSKKSIPTILEEARAGDADMSFGI